MGRILFLLGLAVGYVFGARAGRGAYERLRGRVDRVAHDPNVGRVVDAAKQAAEQAAPKVAGTVEGVVGAIADGATAKRTDGGRADAADGGVTGTTGTIGEGTRASAPAKDDPTATATD